ncbi:hypothetical protein CC2G_012169 [Coprinopsis cinerea AmutBmut pab1-1]|nr:hypothetical protein CC2G_012169 [Coprinopsis cinerea AmutBmut pab1-1]
MNMMRPSPLLLSIATVRGLLYPRFVRPILARDSRLRVYITSSSRIYSTPSKTPPRSAKAHTAKQPNSDTDYNPKATRLAAFFAQYAPEFKYQPSNPANHEFHRLQKLKGWKIPKSSKETSKEGQENPTKKKKKKKTKGEKAYKAFQDALVMQFNDTYGTDESDLASWQALCRAIGFAPIPDTLKHCQQVVEQTFSSLLTHGKRTESFPRKMRMPVACCVIYFVRSSDPTQSAVKRPDML